MTGQLRNCTVLGNTENGVNGSSLDLGTVASPGGNVFQSASLTLQNGGVGVCGTGEAVGNHWSSCTAGAVSVNPTGKCAGGYDTNSAALDATGCATP